MGTRVVPVAGPFLAWFLAISCGSSSPPEWKPGSPGPSVESDRFFEPGDLRDREGGDAFVREWYSKHLLAADEPSLRHRSSQMAYRFIHLPSFRHPVVIRVENERGSRFIVVKELDGAGGYDPGRLVTERHRQLTSSEWRQIEDVIAGTRFWALPRHQCETRDHPDDGFVWILEGRLKDEYTAVQWHWEECGACKHLVELAEIDLSGIVPSQLGTFPSVPPPPELE